MKLQSIDDLRASPRNPRKISGEALAGLKTSLASYGDISGIVWNERTGELVAGHQRVRALKALYGEKLRIEGTELAAPDGGRWTIRVGGHNDGVDALMLATMRLAKRMQETLGAKGTKQAVGKLVF